MSLIAGTVTNIKESPKVTTITISDNVDSINVEFWEDKTKLVKNVCVNTFVSVYAKKTSNRVTGYAIKRQGIWNFPTCLKEEPPLFKSTVKDLIEDGIIEDCNYTYELNVVQNLIAQTVDVSKDISDFFSECIVEEQNIIISTVTQIDKYNDSLIKISVPVTENNKTVYYKIAFRGKQGQSACDYLTPENGMKKRALFSCGKIREYNGIPNTIGFAFKLL
jgi:hypothetical protein